MPAGAGPRVSNPYTTYHVCIFALEDRLLVIATSSTINYEEANGYIVHYAFYVPDDDQEGQFEEFVYMRHHFFNPNGNELCSFCAVDPTLNNLAEDRDLSDSSDQEDENLL